MMKEKNRNDTNIQKLKKIMDTSNNIVFFGGAGVSTASGIKDFRGANGLYKEKLKYPPEYYLSSKCLYNDSSTFFQFYKERMNCIDIKPNSIHIYLTKLEEKGKLKAIITQNIDGLHQKAGSKNVLEIHGTIYDNYCVKCGKNYSPNAIFECENIPRCKCGGMIRPNVVLYGEMLPECYSFAQSYISKADTLIVAGTSLTVEPASSLIELFRGKNLIILNKENTPYDTFANLVIHDDLSKIFDSLL